MGQTDLVNTGQEEEKEIEDRFADFKVQCSFPKGPKREVKNEPFFCAK